MLYSRSSFIIQYEYVMIAFKKYILKRLPKNYLLQNVQPTGKELTQQMSISVRNQPKILVMIPITIKME